MNVGRPARKYVRRVQTMLTEQQYELIQEYAQEMQKSVSALIREAVEDALIVDLEQHRKKKALAWMARQNLPVDDWEVMERQIESRWEEDWHE